MAQPIHQHSTVEEYLRGETESFEKHEYYDGEIYAMAGGTPRHNLISTNITSELRSRLRGSGCRPYNSDQRIYIPANGLFTYPDASVICGQEQYALEDSIALTNPIVIVEVLSPSTRKKDRFNKFELYQQLESLDGYLLVEQARPHIQYWQRTENGRWIGEMILNIAHTLEINVLGIELPLTRIYEDIVFDPPLLADPT